jgi:hypothetical protein
VRVAQRDLGLLQQVLRAAELELGDHAALEHVLVDLDFARRALAIDLGLRDELLRVRLAVLDIELAAADAGLEPRERGLLLREPALQLGARDRRERLAERDLVAGTDVEVDRAGSDRVQGRAVRGDHPAVRHHIAHEVAALDRRDPDARPRHGPIGTQPAAQHVRAAAQDHERDRRRREPAAPRTGDRGLREGSVGGGRIADHRTPPTRARGVPT